MYQLKEDVLATRGDVRVRLVCDTPFDEPRTPRRETAFVRRPLSRLRLVGACALLVLVLVLMICEQTRNDVRRERRAQVCVTTGARNEALQEWRPYREQRGRRIVRAAIRRCTFPISYLSS